MLFNSYEFVFLFLPIAVLVFYQIGGRGHHRAALSWLVGASLFFYAWWNPAYLGLIIGSILFNYAIGVNLARSRQKWLLVVGITGNLLLLGYYKYANFFLESVNGLTGGNWTLGQIVLPLAISFFTFQQITYLVDAWKGETREYNFLHYCLFVTFFPQLIAGPIVHHRQMLPQFASETTYRFDYRNIAIGLSIFLLGLFKKVVIADSHAPYANAIFSAVANGELVTFFEAWKGALAYTFQLYFDFSGYSDMAVGIAMLFGIRLPLNFNSPYKSRSIIEFWKRWHMTLSRFLRDYLYIPLGGNRKGRIRRYRNLMITMLLGGLWHGAGWTFVIWGGLHGLYLVVNHLWRGLKRMMGLTGDGNRLSRFAARLVTFLAVVVAWVFFRAEDLPSALELVKSMAGLNGVVWPESARAELGGLAVLLEQWGMEFRHVSYFNGMGNVYGLLAVWLFVWYAPNLQQVMATQQAVLDPPVAGRLQWRASWGWGLWVGLLGAIAILKLGEVSEFLYFQF